MKKHLRSKVVGANYNGQDTYRVQVKISIMNVVAFCKQTQEIHIGGYIFNIYPSTILESDSRFRRL